MINKAHENLHQSCWGKEPSGATPIPAIQSKLVSLLHSLSISSDPSPGHNDPDPPSTQPNSENHLPEVKKPTKPDTDGINPEDLPLEDPEPDVDGSEDGMSDGDGWWERHLDDEDMGSEQEDSGE